MRKMRKGKFLSELKIKIVAILVLGVIVFSFYLIYKLPVLNIPILIGLPIISYLIFTGKITFISNKEVVFVVILILSIIISLIMYGDRHRQFSFYAEPIIDRKYVTEEMEFEAKDGTYYGGEITRYIPKTKKGKSALNVIKWTLYLITAGSIYVCYYIFSEVHKYGVRE